MLLAKEGTALSRAASDVVCCAVILCMCLLPCEQQHTQAPSAVLQVLFAQHKASTLRLIY